MRRITEVTHEVLSDGLWLMFTTGIISVVVIIKSIMMMFNGNILMGLGAFALMSVLASTVIIFGLETGVIGSMWVDDNGIPITDPSKYPEN